MTPLRLSDSLKEFHSYYLASIASTMPILELRPKQLRVSGLPYCALRHAYELMANIKETHGNFGSNYYTSVGTAAHTAFQRFLGAHGRIYGEWKCLNKVCGRHVKFGARNTCKLCGSEMQYEEFTVTHGKHLSGHTDGLFKDKFGRFWIIDYKTCSTRIIEGQKSGAFKLLPYTKNVAQIEAYVVLIEEKFDIDVAGWMLIYIARDDPTCIKVCGKTLSDDDKQVVAEKLDLYDTQYGIVQRLKNYKQLQYLIDNKFCQSHEHYNTDMKGFNGCALAPVCFGKRLKSVLRLDMDQYLEACKTKED